MKKCCKKWKDNYLFSMFDHNFLTTTSQWKEKDDLNFCPKCSSSLKDEKDWCNKCIFSKISPTMRPECAECLHTITSSSMLPTMFKPKEESKCCECVNRSGQTVGGGGHNYCHDCENPINPTPKLPKKLSMDDYSDFRENNIDGRITLLRKIDQIIDYIKAKGI